MVPDEIPDEVRANLLDPAIMGPPIVWLASSGIRRVDDERIIAREFDDWLAGARESEPMSSNYAGSVNQPRAQHPPWDQSRTRTSRVALARDLADRA